MYRPGGGDMRAVWNGAISFGLVNIPCSLFSGEQKNDLKFNLLDSRDENRIRYERINEETGEEVPWNQIVKAFEFKDDQYVLLTDEDFERADVEASKTIDIETFIEREELELKYLEKPYYIQAKKGGEKAYVLLRDALNETQKIAIARVVIRTREHLAAIYTSGEILILNLIRFSQELRSEDKIDAPKKVKVTKKEMDMAVQLIETMTEEWVPDSYEDEYRKALMELISKKAEGIEVEVEEEEEGDTSKVVDIMDLLQQSVQTQEKENKKTKKRKSS